jgi:hypothetical protein
MSGFEGFRILCVTELDGTKVRLLERDGMLLALPVEAKTAVRVVVVRPDAEAEAFKRGFMSSVLLATVAALPEGGMPPVIEFPEDTPVDEDWFKEAVEDLFTAVKGEDNE